jgi:uncharacterized protein YdgA (DUF945 family)
VNRGLRIGLIVVVVLALAYPAAAWMIGMSVQHQELEREKAALAQAPYLEVVNRDYRRGIYSSTEEITFKFGGSLLQNLPGASQNGSGPFQFTVRSHIHHGPLPQLRAFAPATADTEIILPPEVQKKLTQIVGDQAHLTIHSQFKWSGGATSVVQSTPFKTNIPDAGTFEWRGLDGTSEVGREVGTQVGQFTAPGLVANTPQGNFSIEDVKASTDLHLAFGDLTVGKIRFSAGHVAFDSPVQPDFKIDTRNLAIQGDSSVSGDFVNTDGTFSIDSVESVKFSATRLVWEVRMDHIHGPSMASLNKELMAAQAEQLQASVPSDPNDPAAKQRQMEVAQKYLAAFQTYGLQILGHEPVIELPRVGFKTADGDVMLSVKLEAPGITPADVSGDPKTLALTLPKFLQATINARIDDTLLNKLLQQTMSGPDASNQVKARLQQLQDQGYIKVDGKALITQITFMNGQLKINGLPFTPAALAPPQEPQRTPPGRKPSAPRDKRVPH